MSYTLRKAMGAASVIALALFAAAGLSAQTPKALQLGSWISGNLRAAGEEWFSVVSPQGGILIVETSGNIDTYLEIYDQARNLVAENDDGEDEGNARLEFFNDAGKTYLVKLRGYDGDVAGAYRLLATFETLPPDTARNTSRSGALAIQPGKAEEVYLRAANESRWYSLSIPSAGKLLRVYTEGTLDTMLSLYDTRGTLLQENDDTYEDDFNAMISMNVSLGTVYIEVKQYDGLQGRTSLHVEFKDPIRLDSFESDDSMGTAKEIRAGQSQERNFHDDHDQDWALLRITQAGTYEIRTSAKDKSLDTWLDLYDSQSDEPIASDDDSGGELDALISERLAPGEYYINVGNYFNERLDNSGYTLSVSRR